MKESLGKSDIKRVCDILRRDDGVGAKDYVEQFSWLLFLKVFENVEKQLKELEEAEGKRYKNIIDEEYQWSSWAKKDWKDKDELIHFVNQKLFPYLRGLKGSQQKEKIAEIFRELPGNRIRSPHNLLDVIDVLDQIDEHHIQDTHLLSQVYEEILQEMGTEGGWSGEIYTPRPAIRLMIKILNPKLGETIYDPFAGSCGFLVESFNYVYENSPKDVRSWKTLQTKTFFGQEKKPLPFLIGTMNMILHRILLPNLIRKNTLDEDVHNVQESSKYDVILTNPPFGGEEEKRVAENYPIKTSATEAMALQYIVRHLKNGGKCGVVLPEGNIMFGGGAMAKIRQELLEKCDVHSIISLPQGVFTQMGAGVKTSLIFFEKNGQPTKQIWFGELNGDFTRVNVLKDEHLEEIFKKWEKKEVSANSWIKTIEEIRNDNFNISAKNPNKKENDYKSFNENGLLQEIDVDIENLQKVIKEIKGIYA